MRIAMNIIRTSVTVTALALAGADNAQDTKNATKMKLQRLYTEYLTAEGYRPEIKGDGLVYFRREGKAYFIPVSERDQEFFQIILPNIWSIESEKERGQVLTAANHTNATMKVVKVYTVDEQVWVSVELYMASPGDFRAVFKRCLSAMDGGSAKFGLKMLELQLKE
ncbi:MAG: hypothetical protein WBE26_01405 [Phycisphaerae bacterium]